MKIFNNIYSIPVGDKLNCSKDDYNLVYSPLADELMFLTKDQLSQLQDGLNGGDKDDEIATIIDELTTYEPIESRRDQIKGIEDFVTLYVLPNYICNFKCSYCFAAHGRDRVVLDINALKRMLDWMLDTERTVYRRIYVTFLGGGEPMLSYETMKEAIVYGNERATQLGFEIVWSVVTNGSLIKEEELELFKSQNVLVRYSFEIVEDIQNMQRGNYPAVDSSIRLACDMGLSPIIRSMITVDNVYLLEGMVEIVNREYPNVKTLKFDPITDAEMGADIERMKEFYEAYYSHFMKAREIGLSYGIDVQCVTIRNMDSVMQRFCAGEISLNGYGEITACHRVSSPREDHYEEMKYGKVTADGVTIDHNKFKDITSDTVQTKAECEGCFLKYNCAGGCWAQNLQYTEDMREIVCHYNRKMSRDILFERVDNQIKEEYNMSLKELVAQ